MSAKSARESCDRYTRDIVRARDRSCRRCGWTPPSWKELEAAHLIPRRYSRTRCVLDNLLALCHDCHRLIDTRDTEKLALIQDTIGMARYAELEELAHDTSGQRVDWPSVRAELRPLYVEAVA